MRNIPDLDKLIVSSMNLDSLNKKIHYIQPDARVDMAFFPQIFQISTYSPVFAVKGHETRCWCILYEFPRRNTTKLDQVRMISCLEMSFLA